MSNVMFQYHNRISVITLKFIFVLIGSSCNEAASVAFISQPKDIYVALGEKAVMQCIFNDIVECYWKRADSIVYPTNNYQFSQSSTRNCSMTIKEASSLDFTKWLCATKAKDDGDSLISNAALLSQKKPAVSENISSDLGQSVSLPCVFGSQTHCVWKKNGASIESTKDYAYTEQNTKECSLIVKNVSGEDFTKWLCQSLATSNQNSLGLHEVVLTQREEPIQNSTNTVKKENRTDEKVNIDATWNHKIILACGIPITVLINIVIVYLVVKRKTLPCNAKKEMTEEVAFERKDHGMDYYLEISNCGESKLSPSHSGDRLYDSVCPDYYENVQARILEKDQPQAYIIYADLQFSEEKASFPNIDDQRTEYAVIKENS